MRSHARSHSPCSLQLPQTMDDSFSLRQRYSMRTLSSPIGSRGEPSPRFPPAIVRRLRGRSPNHSLTRLTRGAFQRGRLSCAQTRRRHSFSHLLSAATWLTQINSHHPNAAFDDNT